MPKEDNLKKLDSQYKLIRNISRSIIVLTIIIDTFPFWASSSLFCYGMGFHIPKYEGGIWVSIMTIITIIGLIGIGYQTFTEWESPSNQYYQIIKNQEAERRRRDWEDAKAKALHEQNIMKYGEGYIEICPQFILNEKEKKVWLCQTEYSFREIIDAEIEDSPTQHTTGADVITKTSTGSMLGRSLVGGFLNGGVGAIIGGATAKKESIMSPTQIFTVHRYNLLITTSRITNPLITIPFYNDGSLAQKSLATLKAIIHSN